MTLSLKKGSMVVYPSHGVGQITGKETQTIAGMEIASYVVFFERDKLTLRIPAARAEKSGMRELVAEEYLERVNKTLKGRARAGRGMWSRRAKEYEAKINSGNIIQLSEVVRDLHKNVEDPDRSYSERVIYENALNRLAGEFSAVRKSTHEVAIDSIVTTINENKPAEENVVTINPVEDDFDEFDEFEEANENEDSLEAA